MSLQIEVTQLPTPQLELGDSTTTFVDPRIGLTDSGPFSLRLGAGHKSQIRVGLVGPRYMLDLAQEWLVRVQKPIKTGKANETMYIDFPGFEQAFRSELSVHHSWHLEIGQDLSHALLRSGGDRFETVLNVYASAVEKLTKKYRLDVVFCCLPAEVVTGCWTIARALTPAERARISRRKRATDSAQLTFSDQWGVEDIDQDLLRRDFRRALKAKTMAFNVPTQLATTALFVDADANQDAATRAWNSSVALFYKAGGLPWRVKFDGPETCFVGISFHYVKRASGNYAYSSLAQAFSTEGDGFTLRGDALPRSTGGLQRGLHLDAIQAERLGARVLDEYLDRTGRYPNRVVLHKTTQFDDAERSGFNQAFRLIPVVEYASIAPADFRLVQRSAYPPKRGTVCRVNDAATFLFTTGFVPEWRTYPGVHVPAPVRIRTGHLSDALRIAREVLALARMNWNTAFDTTGAPITLRFARQVGGIMAEVTPPNEPHPSYRFYI